MVWAYNRRGCKIHDAVCWLHTNVRACVCECCVQAAAWQGGAPGDQLLASSSRSEVLLWRADGFDAGPAHSWQGLTRGRMNPAATQVGVCDSTIETGDFLGWR
eukprot:GHRQ01024117.1.p3 GENE.GHRQ01024117.1~~GHRQ01024117.1.p3  ORF type:complete len:103 (-),score=24.97 GHRQ01024117.1:481-789(-)